MYFDRHDEMTAPSVAGAPTGAYVRFPGDDLGRKPLSITSMMSHGSQTKHYVGTAQTMLDPRFRRSLGASRRLREVATLSAMGAWLAPAVSFANNMGGAGFAAMADVFIAVVVLGMAVCLVPPLVVTSFIVRRKAKVGHPVSVGLWVVSIDVAVSSFLGYLFSLYLLQAFDFDYRFTFPLATAYYGLPLLWLVRGLIVRVRQARSASAA